MMMKFMGHSLLVMITIFNIIHSLQSLSSSTSSSFSVVVHGANTELNTVFTSIDKNHYLQLAKDEISGTTSSYKSMYFASKLLKVLSEGTNNEKTLQPYCDQFMKKMDTETKSPMKLTYMKLVLENLKCNSQTLPVDTTLLEKILKKAYNSKSLKGVYYAVMSGYSKYNTKDVIDVIAEEFDENVGNGDYDIPYMILEIMNALNVKEGDNMEEKERKKLDKLFGKITKALVPDANDNNDKDSTDPTLIVEMEQFEFLSVLSIENANLIAYDLMALKYTKSVDVAYKVYAGLLSLSKLPNKPYVVRSIDQPVVASGDKITFKITNLFGEKVTAMNGNLVQLKSKKSVVLSDVELAKDKKGFSLETTDLPSSPYFAVLNFDITSERSLSVRKKIVITSEVDVSNVALTIVASKKMEDGDKIAIQKPNTLPSDTSASYAEADNLYLTFDVTPVKPHQSFVRFTHIETGQDTFYVAKPSINEGSSTVGISFALIDVADNFDFKSGEYLITILLGDLSMGKQIEWVVGSLDLSLPVYKEKEYPLYTRALSYESDHAKAPLKNIEHQFRAPASRPSAFITSIFNIGVLLPVLFLLGGFAYVGVNFKNFPSGMGGIWMLIFHSCIGSIVALFCLYWLSISMNTTLQLFFLIGIVTCVTGQKALKARIAEKTAVEKPKAE